MQIYKVGGAVRDELLGVPVVENDWVVVGATPQDMKALGFRLVGKDFPVFLHPQTHEEYALARTERKSSRGHTGFTCYSAPDVTLEQDLARRDLTVNAIAIDENGEIIDPYNGQQDITDKILRHVTDAFQEDPLRVYRVARFQAKLADKGFTIAPETLQLMQRIIDNGELQTLSAERIWRETYKALLTPSPAAYFKTLQQLDILRLHFPHMTDTGIRTLDTLSHNTTLNQSDLLTPEILFAAATYEGDIKLSVPKPYQQLQHMVQTHRHDITSLFEHDAEAILKLLKKLDALRRTERFLRVVQAALLIAAPQQTLAKLIETTARYQSLLDALQAVDIKDLIKQYQHKALADKIAERQIETIRRTKPAKKQKG